MRRCLPKKTKDGEEYKSSPKLAPDVTNTEILDEIFQSYKRIAKAILNTLRRPKDVQIALELLRNCQKLNASRNAEVKQYTNEFLKYLLKVLQWTSNYQLDAIYDVWYDNECPGKSSAVDESGIKKMWLEKEKSYFAVKTMNDGSAIIYTAVAKDPQAGWQEGGLKNAAGKVKF